MDHSEPNSAPESGANAGSQTARALVPAGSSKALRAPMVIDAKATKSEHPANAGAPKPKPGMAAAPKFIGAWRPAAIAAALAIGLGTGFGGGVVVARNSAQTQALAAALKDVRSHVAAMEAAKAGQDGASSARAAVSALKAEVEKSRAAVAAQSTQIEARLDKLDRDTSAHFDRDGRDVAARFEKIEKTLMARDATSSIHTLPAPASVPAASQPAAAAPAASAPARPRVPPGGWVLLDVRGGVATVEGPNGARQVFPGDVLPGAGRVVSVERRAGQWVLVTSLGLIDQRDY